MELILPLRSDQQNELFEALASAQGEMSSAEKSAGMAGTFGKNKKYANYDDMVFATRPSLSKHKISVCHDIIQIGEDRYLYTITTHSSGQFKAGWIRLDPDYNNKARNPQQELGSCITYYKRYAYSAAIGLTFDDGDDYDSPKYQGDEKQGDEVKNRSFNSDLGTGEPSEAQLRLLASLAGKDPEVYKQACTELQLDPKELNKTTARQLISRLKGDK